jgi:hypothetical protein
LIDHAESGRPYCGIAGRLVEDGRVHLGRMPFVAAALSDAGSGHPAARHEARTVAISPTSSMHWRVGADVLVPDAFRLSNFST